MKQPVISIEPSNYRAETCVVTKMFEYPLRLAGKAWKRHGCLVIHPGFEFDGGSIPRFLWSVINVTPFTPSWIAAFAGHDATTGAELLPFSECDALLRDMGKAYGNTLYQRQAVYAGVRTFGYVLVYRKHTRASIDATRTFVEYLP